MTNLKKQGNELQQQRVALGLTQASMRTLIEKAEPNLRVPDTLISDIECGRSGSGPKASRIRELMREILASKSPVTASQPATSFKKITIQSNGFSLEASTNAVKQLAALGIPTAEVKAALIKTFSSLLDQAEK